MALPVHARRAVLRVVGRMKPETTLEQARAELTVISSEHRAGRIQAPTKAGA
jgi:hypothetical protein